MNRLRVRVELNRRKSGVPMHELVSVVEETHKFFQLLAEDVHIEAERGEWHASSFDPESLNFTAEFSGPASTEQIRAFGSAFGGATSLRRDTIAQFTRIADFIGEDELVGFGLYQSDQETEPSDWRCLSRQDALRFADEIRLLAKATGESEQEAALPAVMNGSVGGRRLFKDRRERETLANDPTKWIRDVESSLSRRIALLEGEIEKQTRKIQTLENTPDAEEKFLKMLGALGSFQPHAQGQLQLTAGEPIPRGFESPGESSQVPSGKPAEFTPHPTQPGTSRLAWGVGLAVAAAALILGIALSRPKGHSQVQAVQATSAAPAPLVLSAPSAPDLAGNITTAAIEANKKGPSESENTSSFRDTASRDAAPEMAREIALDIPQELKSLVDSEVRVSVAIGIDRDGKVMTAEVASTRGEGADVLAPEALKAARWFRFRPARQGTRNVPSHTLLTFTFKPDALLP